MIKIVYQRESIKADPEITVEGTGPEILNALIELIAIVPSNVHADRDKFFEKLPALVALKDVSIDHVKTIDFAAIQKMKEGLSHE